MISFSRSLSCSFNCLCRICISTRLPFASVLTYSSEENERERMTPLSLSLSLSLTMLTFFLLLETQSPASKRSNDCLLSSSLSPVKRLLNESIDSNIEIIQMDEQDCILEIVDGVLTIVPKDKSSSSSSVDMTSKKMRDHHHRHHALNPTFNSKRTCDNAPFFLH